MRLVDPDNQRALVLASSSRTRADMLRRAGLDVVIDPPDVDETVIKDRLRVAGDSADAVAEALAEAKALDVSRRRGSDLVIGADQMLECEGRWFDKPIDLDDAKAHLRAFSGREHRLISSVVVACDGVRIWHGAASARLRVRSLGYAFIEAYVAAAGSAILGSVGAYQLEGLGAQLFERIDGDHFTILGMPLLPLMEFLRGEGVLLS